MTILNFYLPDGRKYVNWEIVTFMNDSLKDYLLYEWYIKKYDDMDYGNTDNWFKKVNMTNYHKKTIEEYENKMEPKFIKVDNVTKYHSFNTQDKTYWEWDSVEEAMNKRTRN